MRKLQLFSHPSLLQHERAGHPESPARLEAIFSAIEKSSFQKSLDLSLNRLATPQDLTKVHSTEYVENVLSLADKVADLDHETPLSEGSVHAARLVAGLGLEAVERVIAGEIEKGFVLGRPPGHHARPDQGMGFCVFNNIAIAAHRAISLGLKRILILDWDVHHGNGTQEAFYDDDRVLFIDLHQDDLFPKSSGLLAERGKDRGLGYTVNVPLPHSCRDDDYLAVLDHLVMPLAERYKPELILVSAGFDAHEADPLGSMSVTTQGFGLLTERVKILAREMTQGKALFFLEGGYNPAHLAQNVLQCVTALSNEEIVVTQKAKAYTEEVTLLSEKIDESITWLTS